MLLSLESSHNLVFVEFASLRVYLIDNMHNIVVVVIAKVDINLLIIGPGSTSDVAVVSGHVLYFPRTISGLACATLGCFDTDIETGPAQMALGIVASLGLGGGGLSNLHD